MIRLTTSGSTLPGQLRLQIVHGLIHTVNPLHSHPSFRCEYSMGRTEHIRFSARNCARVSPTGLTHGLCYRPAPLLRKKSQHRLVERLGSLPRDGMPALQNRQPAAWQRGRDQTGVFCANQIVRACDNQHRHGEPRQFVGADMGFPRHQAEQVARGARRGPNRRAVHAATP